MGSWGQLTTELKSAARKTLEWSLAVLRRTSLIPGEDRSFNGRLNGDYQRTHPLHLTAMEIRLICYGLR